MKTGMQQILEELCEMEPALREKEEPIRKIIMHMLARKPQQISAPENFKKTLGNRLVSEIALENGQKIRMRNRRFRVLWYLIGGGALASFALGFGFLSIFGITDPLPSVSRDTIATPSIRDTSIATPVMMSGNTDNRTIALSETRNTETAYPADKKSVSKKDVLPMEKPEEALKTTGESESSPVAVSMMSLDVWVPVSSDKQEISIAYIGEGLSLWTPSKTTFSDIVSQAQEKANILVEEPERSSYVLKTPHLGYMSVDSGSAKNTVEMVRAYLFPLERTDGKVPKVMEIGIAVP